MTKYDCTKEGHEVEEIETLECQGKGEGDIVHIGCIHCNYDTTELRECVHEDESADDVNSELMLL